MKRREFLSGAVASAAALAATVPLQAQPPAAGNPAARNGRGGPGKTVLISKYTGTQGMARGHEILVDGGDTLDAAIHVCQMQEDDPNDQSVGLGGLPNEDGEVELDSCCMHGPTRRAGSVGGVRNIKNVARLARKVMERTGHVMLVAEGAHKFAIAHGFTHENLLTERSRKTWLLWKESMSDRDWWGPGISDPNWKSPGSMPPGAARAMQGHIERLAITAAELDIEPEWRRDAIAQVLHPPTGTIHVSALNAQGEISGATTTSGLAWKLAGRLGDSPILGAGCWTDQDVGSAGATGSGEENIKVAGAHSIVELMRQGKSPQEAGMETLRRIARNYNNDMNKLRFLDMIYYILRVDGSYAGVSLWSGTAEKPARFAVHDGKQRIEKCVALFPGTAIDWPPIPALPA